MTNNIRKLKSQGTIFEIFVISENEEYITGIKLNDLSDASIQIIKERFKNRKPDKELMPLEKLEKIDGMDAAWLKSIRTFKKSRKKVSEEDKIYAQKYYNNALELEELKVYLSAIETLKKAINLDPNNQKYKNKIIELEQKIKQEEANNTKKQDIKEQEANEYYQKSINSQEEEKYEEAIEYIEKAITLDNKNPKYNDKLKEISITIATKSKNYYEKGLNLEEDGKYEEAIEYIEKAINLSKILKK